MRWINTDQSFMPHLAEAINLVPTANAVCLAEFDDADPVAGLIFDGFNGRAVHGHLWIAPGRKPSRKFWFCLYDYPFTQLGVQTVIGTVPSSNEKAKKLDAHIGFKLQAVIPNYYPNGDDMLMYVITPDNAPDWKRFLPKNIKNEE